VAFAALAAVMPTVAAAAELERLKYNNPGLVVDLRPGAR
jgi:hypothetical protein